MKKLRTLSAVVLTKNQEKNIVECIKSLTFCDEVLVIDDNSIDKTIYLARSNGAKVFSRSLNNDFSSQRNFGLEKAKGEWVLFLDADEKVSDELQKEILRELNLKDNPYTGYYFRRSDFIWGRELKFGETGNIKLLRLAKKGSGKWKRKVHEVWQIEGRIKTLRNPLIHHPHQTLSEFIADINFHTNLDISAKIQEGKRSSLLKIIYWPIAKFKLNWLLRLGFLDETQGFVIAILMSFHSFLSWSKLWLNQKKN